MEENLSLEFILATIKQKTLYLEEHPETKANGFYTRKLATKYEEIENFKSSQNERWHFLNHVLFLKGEKPF